MKVKIHSVCLKREKGRGQSSIETNKIDKLRVLVMFIVCLMRKKLLFELVKNL